ncbi:MAG: Rab family GTPase [Promethearchaeota archaeon]
MSYRGKVILLGNAGVGKTSLLNRYVDGVFHDDYVQTVGANFLIKEVNMEGIIEKLLFEDTLKAEDIKKKGFTLYFWDIGGQSDKLFVTEYYFYQALAAMVVFNVVDEQSFNDVDFWVSKMKEFSGDIPFIIVGNKVDLEEKRVIDSETMEKKAKELGVNFFETSAKTQENVDKAFRQLSIAILNNLK